MDPVRVFFIRATAALVGAGLITWFFFGELSPANIGLFGGIMLAAAYVSEAARKKRK